MRYSHGITPPSRNRSPSAARVGAFLRMVGDELVEGDRPAVKKMARSQDRHVVFVGDVDEAVGLTGAW